MTATATMEAEASLMGAQVKGVPLPHLAAWRHRRLLTQRDLAKAAGVSHITIARIERGDRAGFATVKKLAATLGVSTDELRFRAPGSSG